ncbi:PREDICTED: putative glycerol-3-phosphate [Prunus dulcis]|uniref:PREDICTED: putative glycerol-3-phosphate n=1 Tax=Prunus dulcis TaxID=3755 RepID=A0A5E4EZV7_PRUDU|nr:putative glycerol-3-phosphate transporter 5 [Prunus dulcis]VVA20700.1 PREDICTED: putative glycerol-3-phosphate [Prunus dulcis]
MGLVLCGASVLVILVGILVFLFLPVNPEDLGFESRVKEIQINTEVNGIENLEGKVESEEAGLLGTENVDVDTSADTLAAVGFWEAWRLPGVAPFALCLFFSKLVSYTFLYWLPFYVRHTAAFDIGGVFGGILAGLISDTIEARAVTSITFLLLSIPALVFYRVYGSLSMVANILLMFLSGLLVNGPYSLITTAVAADLGTQTVIRGNSRALATVTAIIDGTGFCWGGPWATFSGVYFHDRVE